MQMLKQKQTLVLIIYVGYGYKIIQSTTVVLLSQIDEEWYVKQTKIKYRDRVFIGLLFIFRKRDNRTLVHNKIMQKIMRIMQNTAVFASNYVEVLT